MVFEIEKKEIRILTLVYIAKLFEDLFFTFSLIFHS